MSEMRSNETRWSFTEVVLHVLAFCFMLSFFVQVIFEAFNWLKHGEVLSWSVSDQFSSVAVMIDDVKWVGLRRVLQFIGGVWVSIPFAVTGTLMSYRLRGFK